jgi:hypothetical protein
MSRFAVKNLEELHVVCHEIWQKLAQLGTFIFLFGLAGCHEKPGMLNDSRI